MNYFLVNLGYGIVAITISVLTGIIVHYKQSFGFWKRKGVPYLEPSIPLGNASKMFAGKASIGEQFRDYYEEFKSRGLRYGGVFLFARPFCVIVDPVLVKHVLQKDFQHFVDRGFYVNEEVDPLTGHLFSMGGNKWKSLRTKLSATFTSGKMKMMFETLANCTAGLDKLMENSVAKDEPLEIKDILARFTTDIISSCAFGLESNSLSNPDADFRKHGRRIFEHTFLESLKNLLQFAFSNELLSRIRYKNTKPDVEDFIMGIVKRTVEYRETNNVSRKDFLQLLIQMKNGEKVFNEMCDENSNKSFDKNGTLSINQMAAQVYAFFIGGFETSSTAMTFTLYELAKNPEIQTKLREEIHRILKKHGDKLTYEAVMEMTYMDKVINESLRKYPPLPFLTRQCTIPYDVPDSNFRLDKGTMVAIPILGIQNDPEYYPDPEKFDPERFSEGNTSTNPGLTWLPFGEGPRICIGLRFGMLQTKAGLTAMLRNYRVAVNDQTKQPLVMDKGSFTMTSDRGMWLDITKIKTSTKVD